MFNLEALKPAMTRAFGRTSMKVQKYSPEILTGLGVAGIVTAGVMASRATLSLSPIIEAKNTDLENIKETRELAEADKDVVYPEAVANQDTAKVYVRTGLDILKLYGPSITLGALSIVSIVSATGILRKRNLAVVAAYKTVEQAFSEYRERVAEEIGEEKELDIYRVRTVEEVEDKETGKKKKVGSEKPNHSPYARFFDELSGHWDDNAEYNLVFLKAVEQRFNERLHARGHVFLNEVYDALDIPRSREGQVVGWFRGNGDDFVDFGMYDAHNNPRASAFVNGYEKAILLDFNVDGVIDDLI